MQIGSEANCACSVGDRIDILNGLSGPQQPVNVTCKDASFASKSYRRASRPLGWLFDA